MSIGITHPSTLMHITIENLITSASSLPHWITRKISSPLVLKHFYTFDSTTATFRLLNRSQHTPKYAIKS